MTRVDRDGFVLLGGVGLTGVEPPEPEPPVGERARARAEDGDALAFAVALVPIPEPVLRNTRTRIRSPRWQRVASRWATPCPFYEFVNERERQAWIAFYGRERQ